MNVSVFVASTWDDLGEYRQVARELVESWGCRAKGMEDHPPASNVIDHCLDEVRASDMVVVIIAFHYGRLIGTTGCSLTELEYEVASDAGKEVLCLAVDEEAPWPRKYSDRAGAGEEEVTAFRERVLRDDRLVGYFDSLESFKAVLSRALARHVPKMAKMALAGAGSAAPAGDAVLRATLEDAVGALAGVETVYVPLSALADEPKEVEDGSWPEQLVPDAFLDDLSPVAAPATAPLSRVEAALGFHKTFLLTGEPGCGKSTTLQHLYVEGATRYLTGASSSVPVRIDVSDGWAGRTFGEIVHLAVKSDFLVPVSLQRLLLLVDGLRGPGEGEDARLFGEIDAWLRSRPACEAVIATRVGFPDIRVYPEVRLQPLDVPRMEAFIEAAIPVDERPAFRAWLGWPLDAEAPDSGLHQLLSNPYNLSRLCHLHRKGRAPRTRGELLRRSVQAAFSREKRVDRGGPDYQTLLAGLGKMAIDYLDSRKSAAMTLDWIRQRMPTGMAAETLIERSRKCGITRPSASGGHEEFVHDLMASYLAAEAFLNEVTPLSDLLEEPAYSRGRRVPRSLDPAVHMAFQLEGGASRFLAVVAEYDPCLAAQSLEGMLGSVDEVKEGQALVARSLVQLLVRADNRARGAVTEWLTRLGEAAVPALLPEMDGPPFVRKKVIGVLSTIATPSALRGVVDALDDADRWVRRAAVAALEALGEGHAGLRTLVGQLTLTWQGGDDTAGAARLADALAVTDPETCGEVCVAAGISAPLVVTAEMGGEEGTEGEEEPLEAEPGEDFTDRQWGREFLRGWHLHPDDDQQLRAAEQWLMAVPTNTPVWGYVWFTLARSRRELTTSLRRRGSLFLRRRPTEPAWPLVWSVMVRAVDDFASLESITRAWLASEASNENWGRVWHEAWVRRPDDAALEQVASGWIRDPRSPDKEWGLVWADLYAHRRDPALRDLGKQWLTGDTQDEPSWGRVWLSLWEADEGRDRLENQGRKWLERSAWENASWSFVWYGLWKAHRGDAALVDVGRRWLGEVRLGHHGWSWVWQNLWWAAETTPELEKRASDWLESQTTWGNRHWPHVFASLWRSADADGRALLWDTGVRWLEYDGRNHQFTGLVLRSLWEVGKSRDLLEKVSVGWLEAAIGTESTWPYVWCDQWDAHPGEATLIELGVEWLSAAGLEERVWLKVWRKLYPFARTAPEFVARSVRFLEEVRPTGGPGWKEVASALAAIGQLPVEHRARLTDAARPPTPDEMDVLHGLLREVVPTDEWGDSWEQVWRSGQWHPQLVIAGIEWLSSDTKDRRPWPFIWRALYEHQPYLLWDELEPLAMEWLGESGRMLAHGWALVWGPTIERTPAEKLLKLGWEWMSPRFRGRSTWPNVFHELWKVDPDRRAELQEIGLGWLEQLGSQGRDGAASVWCDLWERIPGDPRLIRWGEAAMALPAGAQGREIVADQMAELE